MPIYYVNTNKDEKGLHEVHKDDCIFLRRATHTIKLGMFSNEIAAVSYAKSLGYNADGCFFCCSEAHHG